MKSIQWKSACGIIMRFIKSRREKVERLENAVYMKVKNDLSFVFNFQLSIYEHQSTWNPNMPLRDLF